jgi:hypothetical protein
MRLIVGEQPDIALTFGLAINPYVGGRDITGLRRYAGSRAEKWVSASTNR